MIALPKFLSTDVSDQTGKDSWLIRYLAIIFLCTGFVVIALNLFIRVELRPGGPGLIAIGALMMLCKHFGYSKLTVFVAGCGLVILAFLGALTSQGLMSVSWVAVPVGVMMAGWFAGRPAAFLIAAIGVLEIAIMYWLHRQGFIFNRDLPLEVVMIALLVATVVSALVSGATATVFRQQLTQIEESRLHLTSVLNSTREMIWSVDPVSFELQTYNTAFENYFFTTRTPHEKIAFSDLFGSAEMLKAWKDMYVRALRERQYSTEFTGIIQDDILSLRFNVMEREGVVFGISVFCQDITENKKADEKIKFLAFNDVMTGLPNRLAGQESLTRALAFAERYKKHAAVMFLDIDRFKHVNDLYGHLAGDQLLRAVAVRLRQCIRGQDTLCRLSSDEFMVVLTELEDDKQVSNTCERLLNQLKEPFEINGIELYISFSIGAALYPEHGADGDAIMRKADMALSDAKNSGFQSFRLFEQHMNDKLLRYLEIKDALRQAMAGHQFVLFYQPQINLSTGRICGMEALLRWQSPERGLVMPEAFISVAEESGIIQEIGLWALDTACRQAVRWHATGWPELVMSVNLSSAQFQSPDIAQDVLRVLADSGLTPSSLELELTESIMFGESKRVGQILAQWRKQGIRLSIDDFGTGYSSMAYLKRMQVDKLKIDRSFIANIDTDLQNRSIVQGIMHIAKGLNIAITAEGVESKSVENYLRELGSDEVQGYLYARPLPLTEIEQWLTEHKFQTKA